MCQGVLGISMETQGINSSKCMGMNEQECVIGSVSEFQVCYGGSEKVIC